MKMYVFKDVTSEDLPEVLRMIRAIQSPETGTNEAETIEIEPEVPAPEVRNPKSKVRGRKL